jgi:predicted nucleic-acid-binding protein
MLLIDANTILRYTLNDNVEMAMKTQNLIENSQVYLRYEVLAEVVYVLTKVYFLSRKEVADGIKVFLSCPNVKTESEKVTLHTLQTFSETGLDFVDCILYSFKVVNDYDVFTFDKKLNAMIHRLSDQ